MKSPDRVASPIRVDEPLELRHDVLGNRGASVVDDERRPEGQLPDDQPAIRGLEGQRRAGGNPAHECRSARHLDQRVDVLDLAFHGIGPLVAAVAAPSTIVGEDREVRRQLRGQRRHRPRPSIAQRAVDEDQCRPAADTIEAIGVPSFEKTFP